MHRVTELLTVATVALLVAACSSGGDDEQAQVAAERSTSSSSSTSTVAVAESTTTSVVVTTTAAIATTAPAARAAAAPPPAAAPTTAPPAAPAPTTAPTTTRPADIVIQNFMFSPATKSVPRGSPVKVENRDSASHTFTANSQGAWPPCTLNGGQSCTITAPGTPGSYAYRCTFHATMTGTLTVT